MAHATKLVLHPVTERAIQAYLAAPRHAVLISGPGGAGKATLAAHIVEQLLGGKAGSDIYSSHPYIRRIQSVDNKAIPIEAIRELQHFLGLTIPGKTADGAIKRVIVIEDAGLLTIEAQNALLKTLEEPPQNTALVLTAPSMDSLLPTIQSRLSELAIIPPKSSQLEKHFQEFGYKDAEIKKALLLGGELPGLMSVLLSQDTDHPLITATVHARGILQSKSYERLLLVDSLSKQRQLCLDILYILGHMAYTALTRTTDPRAALRWQRILGATHSAEGRLLHNAQAKLVLTDLMLHL